jgi:hypothetical protein
MENTLEFLVVIFPIIKSFSNVLLMVLFGMIVDSDYDEACQSVYDMVDELELDLESDNESNR